jgi:predicted dehydrogenase
MRRDNKQKRHLALIGLGDWARAKHLPTLRYMAEVEDGPELVAVCDTDADRAVTVARAYGVSRTATDAAEVARMDGIDGYVVAVRPGDLEAVLHVLGPTGRPFLTEKPPGLNHGTAQRLAQSVQSPNVVGFNRRYFPIVERFRRLLAEQSESYFVRAALHRNGRRDSPTFRTGTSVKGMPFVSGTAIHTINTLEYLFGPIDEVEAAERKDSCGEPFWLVDLLFSDGTQGRLEVLPCSGVSTERIQVHGRDRSLEMRYSLYSPADRPGRIEIYEDGGPGVSQAGEDGLPWQEAEGFAGEYRDLLALMDGAGTARSTLATSVNTMRVANLIEPLDALPTP